MTQNERLIKLATAPARVLEQVDSILEGRSVGSNQNINLTTLTFTDAAERLNVSRPTIYRLVKKGTLETILIGGCERIRLQTLIDYATRPTAAKKRDTAK